MKPHHFSSDFSNAIFLSGYNFNGKESDNETSTYDYGFRIYNARLGRFLSVDPLTRGYPMLTPFQFASNRPIDGIDLDGLERKRAMLACQNLGWAGCTIDNESEQTVSQQAEQTSDQVGNQQQVVQPDANTLQGNPTLDGTMCDEVIPGQLDGSAQEVQGTLSTTNTGAAAPDPTCEYVASTQPFESNSLSVVPGCGDPATSPEDRMPQLANAQVSGVLTVEQSINGQWTAGVSASGRVQICT